MRHTRKCSSSNFDLPSDTLDNSRVRRARVACDICRRKKLRCSGKQPCFHCQKAQGVCTYTPNKSPASLGVESQVMNQQHDEPSTYRQMTTTPRIPTSNARDVVLSVSESIESNDRMEEPVWQIQQSLNLVAPNVVPLPRDSILASGNSEQTLSVPQAQFPSNVLQTNYNKSTELTASLEDLWPAVDSNREAQEALFPTTSSAIDVSAITMSTFLQPSDARSEIPTSNFIDDGSDLDAYVSLLRACGTKTMF